MLFRLDFDVVITDLLMPQKDGFDLIRQIQSVFPRVKVIAMSGALTARTYLDDTCPHAEIAGLPKPFSKQDLLLTLEQIMNRVSVQG